MTISLFVFALLFLLFALGTIVFIVVDYEDGIVLSGGLCLIIGIIMAVLSIIQFAQGGG